MVSGAIGFQCGDANSIHPHKMCFSVDGASGDCYIRELSQAHPICDSSSVSYCCRFPATGVPSDNKCTEYSQWLGDFCRTP
ncbi:hypothetical protein PGT21_005908 [Puccinia graminis f. sp. tritici]|uniref:Uncharacterized protein n=1 Tax=Puccinia graminis f. sp. tritici TaxID=56615 RepID=A0A5B0QA68_PUCGR|nr:hypothetical protein PGT21_005908 [Puccinia graminis f. sp. tritici]